MLAAVKAVMNQRQAERTYGIAEDELTPALGWPLPALRKQWNARKGKRAGKTIGFPRFKTARSRRSVRFTTGTIRVETDRHHVTLPRLGRIHTCESTRKLARRLEAGTARILSATLSEDSPGRWHVAFQILVHRTVTVPEHVGAGEPVVGADVGVKADSLIVVATPDGRELDRVPASKSLTAAQGRLRALQRRAARQHSRPVFLFQQDVFGMWQAKTEPDPRGPNICVRPRKWSTPQAMKRRPGTSSRWVRPGLPHQKVRLPDGKASTACLCLLTRRQRLREAIPSAGNPLPTDPKWRQQRG
jgi:putative transposase